MAAICRAIFLVYILCHRLAAWAQDTHAHKIKRQTVSFFLCLLAADQSTLSDKNKFEGHGVVAGTVGYSMTNELINWGLDYVRLMR